MIKRYKQSEIDELADILKNDGVISVPTDTVYGICARINSLKARDKLMLIKLAIKNHLPCNLLYFHLNYGINKMYAKNQ